MAEEEAKFKDRRQYTPRFPWMGVLSIVIPICMVIATALIVMYSDINVLKNSTITGSISDLKKDVKEDTDSLKEAIEKLEAKIENVQTNAIKLDMLEKKITDVILKAEGEIDWAVEEIEDLEKIVDGIVTKMEKHAPPPPRQ